MGVTFLLPLSGMDIQELLIAPVDDGLWIITNLARPCLLRTWGLFFVGEYGREAASVFVATWTYPIPPYDGWLVHIPIMGCLK